jgi:Flp pilus assembly protein TadD
VEGAAGCDQCHGSQVRVGFDADRKAWVTEYASLSINCESCHGPARRHVELAQSGRLQEKADIGLPALAIRSKRESVMVCLQCHGEKLNVDRPGEVLSPDTFESRYSVLMPILTDPPYTPDFRHKKFGYQGPHLASACFLNGSMTCTDCHDPHRQHYRDDLWRPLEGRLADGQCTSCHPSKAERSSAHTFHPERSAGARCVACHMPYLQHPAVGDAIPYARADHTIPLPRPGDDERFGITNACASCHRDRTTSELSKQVQTWWGELKPRHPLVEAVIQSGDTLTPEQGARLLLRPDLDAPMLQFAALTSYFQRYVSPDAGAGSVLAARSLRQLTESTDHDVAALALAVLYIAQNDADIRSTVQRRAANPRIGSRLKVVFGYAAWIQQMAGRPDRAVRILTKGVDLLPSDAALLEELGGALAQSGETSQAMSALADSARLEPNRALTHTVMGFTLHRSGNLDGARAAYARAVELNPWDPVPLMRLAIVFLELSDYRAAEETLHRVVELDRSNVEAQLMLARLLAARGVRASALDRTANALDFSPGNPEALELRMRLQEQR